MLLKEFMQTLHAEGIKLRIPTSVCHQARQSHPQPKLNPSLKYVSREEAYRAVPKALRPARGNACETI